MKLADRTKLLDSSGIRKVFDLAAKMTNPVNLSIGQPDFDVPDVIKKAAVSAIEKGFNKYTLTQGIPELNNLMMEKYKKEQGVEFEKSVITSGVSGGILLSIMSIVNPGDEVIITDPYFVMYKHLINLFGGKTVYINTYPDFMLDTEKLKNTITDKTKLLILNSPGNPTGAVYNEEQVKSIANVVNGSDIFLISDEIYSDFVYDADYVSISRFCKNAIVLNGFSKTLAMTGWRVGYALGSERIINELIKLQQYSFVCSPSFAQYAALKTEEIDKTDFFNDYKRKRDIVYNGLKDKFRVAKPGGAFYIFPEVAGMTATDFVTKAIENNLLIIPGSVFSEHDINFRLSFAASDETIEKGIEILNGLV